MTPCALDTGELRLRALIDEIDGAMHASISVRTDCGLTVKLTTDATLDVDFEGNGPAATAERGGRIVRLPTINRPNEFPVYAQACRHVGISSVACFPVHFEDESLGVLCVTSADHHGFDAADLRSGRRAAIDLALLIAFPASRRRTSALDDR